MKVRTKKGTEITLTKQNFIAKGGEGEIYAKNGVAYKICEPGKVIPEQKLTELSVLTDPHIIRPEEMLLDSSGTPVGYTAKFVENCYVLCQIFTKAFRLRNNISPDMVFKLVLQMQKTIEFIHSKKILLVDLNELNFLISDNFGDVFFIDVNSYQTPNYPATAIMESIRDRHCNNKFSTGTDWFSFAIVSFLMQIGIHPYKGKHSSYTDAKTALDGRMLANLTVMNSGVTYPKAACQDLAVIPPQWLQWYKAVLENGQRVAPPGAQAIGIGIVIPVKTITGSNIFDMNKLRGYARPILGYFYHNSTEVVLCDSGAYVNKYVYPLPSQPIKNIGFSKQGFAVGGYLEGGRVKLYNIISRVDIPMTCNASNMMDYDGRIYVQNGTNILEIILTEMGSTILGSPLVVGSCMENNAQFFSGTVVQNLLGVYYVSVFPQSRSCRQYPIKELDGYKIVDAKYENKVLMVVGVNKSGEYDRFVFRFAKDWSGYDVRKIEDITFVGLNFTVLSNGICVSLTEEEDVEIFHSEKDQGGVKKYQDSSLKGDMELYHQGNQTVFTRGSELFTISVKKTP